MYLFKGDSVFASDFLWNNLYVLIIGIGTKKPINILVLPFYIGFDLACVMGILIGCNLTGLGWAKVYAPS